MRSVTTTVPTTAAAGTEVTAAQMTNYARKALTGASWGASASGTAAYNALVDFLASSGGTGGTVVGYEIWDAAGAGAGVRLWWGTLTSTPFTTGTDITFASGALTVTWPILAAGVGYSTVYANRLVDHFTGRTAFGAAPTLNAALTTAASTATALGTELTYTGYARTAVAPAVLNATAIIAGNADTVSNAQANFPAATSAGSANVIGWAFMDTAGTPVLICAGTVTSIAIANNTTPDFPSGTTFLRLS